LVTRKKILIFDEATANIDLKTEETIQKAIKEEFADCTMLIIAHRIQTIQHCDRIMVMENGMKVEFDTPQNLLKKEGSYFKEIYEKSIKEATVAE
jgi:ABC-type multidrug transport system fused ATPase/permease subunit